MENAKKANAITEERNKLALQRFHLASQATPSKLFFTNDTFTSDDAMRLLRHWNVSIGTTMMYSSSSNRNHNKKKKNGDKNIDVNVGNNKKNSTGNDDKPIETTMSHELEKLRKDEEMMTSVFTEFRKAKTNLSKSYELLEQARFDREAALEEQKKAREVLARAEERVRESNTNIENIQKSMSQTESAVETLSATRQKLERIVDEQRLDVVHAIRKEETEVLQAASVTGRGQEQQQQWNWWAFSSSEDANLRSHYPPPSATAPRKDQEEVFHRVLKLEERERFLNVDYQRLEESTMRLQSRAKNLREKAKMLRKMQKNDK